MQLHNAISLSHGDSLPWWKSLPFEFQDLRVSSGTRPEGFRFSKSIINIEATLDGANINSCGEAESPTLAATKALMEIIERASLMRWHRERPSSEIGTSNGWAAHETLAQAKTNAILELIERDAVLTQWYLAVPFFQISQDDYPKSIAEWSCSELSLSEFPEMKLLISTEGLGPSLTCLLMNARGYGVSGHATKTTLTDSIEAAIAEACRAAHHSIRRSFWKDSEILLRRTKGVRVQPGAHAVYYAYHEPFPGWMFGPVLSLAEAEKSWNQRTDFLLKEEIEKFSFQETLTHPVVVGFAKHASVLELEWGSSDTGKILKRAGNRKFSVSTKERSLNLQPHIVS